MSILKLDKVTLGYSSKKIVSNISLEIEQGEYVYVIGENGVGKSTFIKGLINLIKPLSGKIIYDKSIKKSDIGYIPQLNTSMQNFPASVYEIAISGTLNNNIFNTKYNASDKALTDEVLKELKIYNLKDKCFRELSGGQQRKVLLARAMTSTSKILIMDEPVTGLDPKATENFYSLIKKLNIEKNITVIVVSHDMKAAVKYADKVLHLHVDGFCYGDINQFKSNIIKEYFSEEIK